jgi:hypothetical protein
VPRAFSNTAGRVDRAAPDRGADSAGLRQGTATSPRKQAAAAGGISHSTNVIPLNAKIDSSLGSPMNRSSLKNAGAF